MISIGPPAVRRLDRGSIDTDYYVARARRCRARALDELARRLLALFRPRREPDHAAFPALAGGTRQSSKSCPPPPENDHGRAQDTRTDTPGFLA
jgi:hypothetical protein